MIISKVVGLAARREESFYVADVAVINAQYSRWARLLPRVTPFYAVKCSPDPVLIRTLAQLGAGFDCASSGEIDLIRGAGIAAERVIFANPQKKLGDIRHARNNGIKLMTFDSADELRKIAQHARDSELVLRLLPDDSRSIMKFGVKFGAPSETVQPLLALAKELGLTVVGTSFHVGSGCLDAAAFADAVRLARHAFDVGAREGFDFRLLDIGGGFPGTLEGCDAAGTGPVSSDGAAAAAPTFEAIAGSLRGALDECFPDSSAPRIGTAAPHVDIIGEPGRYFATAWTRLAVNVYGRRAVTDGDDTRFLYYVSDGLYGSFNCLMFDHAAVTPLRLADLAAAPTEATVAVLPAAERASGQRRVVALEHGRGGGGGGAHSGLRRGVRRGRSPSRAETGSVLDVAPLGLMETLAASPVLPYGRDATALRYASSFATPPAPAACPDGVVVGGGAGKSGEEARVYPSTIFGPTCDSMDCIAKDVPLPELQVGEWLVFENMGAYTKASASHFNGFAPPEVKYLDASGEFMKV